MNFEHRLGGRFGLRGRLSFVASEAQQCSRGKERLFRKEPLLDRITRFAGTLHNQRQTRPGTFIAPLKERFVAGWRWMQHLKIARLPGESVEPKRYRHGSLTLPNVQAAAGTQSSKLLARAHQAIQRLV